ncbi:XRE family transcriptional regulator [Streptomyces griseofuscus]|uniref:XRE family transcriptional regulator n=1 Tax=Streptomyces griseofuscus TaxID=146922 RepID=A0A7H1Q5Y4_9ACTN|nr:XRE family transcriptional regulator [Streptomyces griseofuscus]
MPEGPGTGVVAAFGRTLKTLRLRAGLDRAECGRRIGYSASTVASFEQGRRIPSPKTIDKADEALGAGGLLSVWKEEVERAQYPVFFQGMAQLEKEAMELVAYDTLVVKGLLQTEGYTRALLAMRRPVLEQEIIEQRVAARLARQEIFDRRPAPFLSFVLDESILHRPYGGKAVLRGQLEHLLLIGEKRNVEIQVMPVDREDNAGVNGPFTVVTRQDGRCSRTPRRRGSAHCRPTLSKQLWLAHAMGPSDHRLSTQESHSSSSKGCWDRCEQR